MEIALRSRLLNASPVSTIVGTRIYWGVRPQGSAYPAIVLTIVSDSRDQDYKGFVSLWQTRVQIDCYGLDRATVVALREAVITAIAPAGTFYGSKFGRAFIDTVQNLGANSETGFIHRDKIDALIWHN